MTVLRCILLFGCVIFLFYVMNKVLHSDADKKTKLIACGVNFTGFLLAMLIILLFV